MIDNEEGLFLNEPAEVYHADAVYAVPSVSASLLTKIIQQTPRHAWWNHPRLNPNYEPQHKAMWDRGTAAHTLTLRAGSELVQIDADDWRGKAAKVARDMARSEGKVPILKKDYAELMRMWGEQELQLDALDGGNPFKDGEAEVVIRWLEKFKYNGRYYEVWCRARLDWLSASADNAYDFKTTEMSANPERWARTTMWNIGAPYQAALYRRGLRRLTKLDYLEMHDPDFLFVLNESVPPYALSLVNVPSDIRGWQSDETADEAVTRALATWAQCLETGQWPGYSPEVHIAQSARPKRPAQPKWSEEWREGDSGGHLSSEDIANSI